MAHYSNLSTYINLAVALATHKPEFLQRLLSKDNFIHAISGASGSVIAMSLFYPLEVIRTRLQVDERRNFLSTFQLVREIISEEDWSALYRGLSPVLTSLYCSNFVFFYSYNGIKAVVDASSIKRSAFIDLLSAAVAGSINVVATCPLWLVNTRLRLDRANIRTEHGGIQQVNLNYNGLLSGIIHVYRTEGVASLWSSIVPSLMLVSNPAFQFMSYEMLKRRFDVSSAGKVFVMGALAKAVATFITYPIQTIQARLRTSKDGNNLLQCLIRILHNQGVLGLYRGIEVKLVQSVLTAALMLVIYEKLVIFVRLILKPRF